MIQSRTSVFFLPIVVLRTLIATVVFLIWTFFLSLLGFVLNLVFNKKKIDDFVIGTWARVTCGLFNVKVVVKGLENIPRGGCLFLFNHSSFFDIFALASAFPFLRFGAKSELFKIPMFGIAMRRTGALPITRGRREETFRVYEEAKVRFLAGERFALSPEGGRFFGPSLSSFKAGPFIFAMSATVPLVPVIVEGAYETLPKGSWLANLTSWSSQITLTVLPFIETKSFTLEKRQELQSLVYTQMNSVWEKSRVEVDSHLG